MITKNDCLLLLSQLSDRGIDTKEMVSKTVRSQTVDIEVINFIHEHTSMDIINFYEKLRRSYNQKKSKLYKSIVEIEDKQPKDIPLTLASLLTQIVLYSNSLQERELFLKHSRAEEISRVLVDYFKNYDLKLSIQLLELVRADIKALELVSRKYPN